MRTVIGLGVHDRTLPFNRSAQSLVKVLAPAVSRETAGAEYAGVPVRSHVSAFTSQLASQRDNLITSKPGTSDRVNFV